MSEVPVGRFKTWNIPAWARAALVCAALGVYWIATLDIQRTWGWDEATHAELPAVRMLLTLEAGDLSGFAQVVHSCQQYPFGWPLVLCGVQWALGISEWLCRAAGLGVWALTLWGVFLLAQELARAQRRDGVGPRRGDDLLPWLALAFAALSPLGLGYGASLFLEVPFACCAVFALRAWLRRTTLRDQPGGALREAVAGLWLAAAFFTKFNYGILLVGGCALDWLSGLLVARRAGRFWSQLHSLPFLCMPFLIPVGWWLLLPLPFGLEMGEQHRRVMLEFLSSNQELAATPWQQRLLYMGVYLTFTGRLFVVQLLGLAGSLRQVLAPGARLLWLVLLVAGVPVWTHNFHLDRFLIPTAPVFWTLAALGLAGLLPARALGRTLVLGPIAALVLVLPSLDGPWLGRKLGLLRGDQATQDYIATILARKHRLGADREMWTPGIAPQTARQILAVVTAEVGREESVGWIGVSTEICPAALHLELLRVSENRERFLRDAHRPVDVTFTGADPGWSVGELREFVQRFDVVISTDPPDIGNRASRSFVRRYSAMLVNPLLGWQVREIGQVMIPKQGSPDLEFSIYALRPSGAQSGP